jgi:signal transduction histidine kinase
MEANSSDKENLGSHNSDKVSQRLERAVDIILALDNQLLQSSFDLDEFLDGILKGVCDLTGAQYAQILLRRGSSLQITHSTQFEDKGEEFGIAECFCGLAVEQKRIVSSGNVEQEYPSRYKWVLGADQRHRMLSEMAIPLTAPTANQIVTGVINIESPLPDAFSKDVGKMLERFALQSGVAIHAARLNAGIALTFHLAESIESEVDPSKALRNTLQELSEFFRGNVVIQFLLYNPATDALRIESSTVPSTEGKKVLASSSFSGLVIKQGEPILSNDVRKEYPDQFTDTVGNATNSPTQSELAVPIEEDGKIIGVLNVESPKKAAFDEHDLYVLSLLASNASLWKRVSQSRRTRALEKMATVGDVAGNMIHILNSRLASLGSIVNKLEAICAGAKPPLPVDSLIAELRSIATSAVEAAENFKGKYERAQMPPEETDINLVVKGIVEKIITRDEIKIVLNLDSHLPMLTVSPAIQDVFWNLVSNAQKALFDYPSGLITIGTRIIKGEYTNQIEAFELFVADNGKGIDENMHEKIFQLETSEDGDGHGWGLWWVETFVERWQGKIRLESELGVGTKITIWFPLTVEGNVIRLKGGQE